MRLDRYVADRAGISRARAQSLIRAGAVQVNGTTESRPAAEVSDGAAVVIGTDPNPYVSRGGLKLAAALDRFAIDPAGRESLDLGASTGGFTEVLLSRGAARVTAVDVGQGQLHQSLRGHPRIISLEKTDVRALTAEHLPAPPDLIAADLSFISLRMALPAALDLAAPGAYLIALIKPQFEAGRDAIGKGGIVKDRAKREAAQDAVLAWLGDQPAWTVDGVMESPVTGGDGNTEYLCAARKAGPPPKPKAAETA